MTILIRIVSAIFPAVYLKPDFSSRLSNLTVKYAHHFVQFYLYKKISVRSKTRFSRRLQLTDSQWDCHYFVVVNRPRLGQHFSLEQ